MLRFAFLAVALALPAVPAQADPDGMCGLEDASSTRTPCPSYVTYDEEGREIGGQGRS